MGQAKAKGRSALVPGPGPGERRGPWPWPGPWVFLAPVRAQSAAALDPGLAHGFSLPYVFATVQSNPMPAHDPKYREGSSQESNMGGR